MLLSKASGLEKLTKRDHRFPYLNADAWYSIVYSNSLTELILQEESHKSIPSASITAKPFPKLRQLNIELTRQAFKMLVSLINEGGKMDITESSSIVSTPMKTGFPMLEVLQLLILDTTADAVDLVVIAQNCPSLLELRCKCVWGADKERPYDLCDRDMDEISSRLPHLNTLILDFGFSPQITEKTLMSLGNHCKKLTMAQLYANPRFEMLAQSSEPNLFPALKHLKIWETDYLPDRLHCGNLRTLVTKLRNLAPVLETLDSATFNPHGSREFILTEAWWKFWTSSIPRPPRPRRPGGRWGV